MLSSLTATLGVFTNPLSIASFNPKSDTIHGNNFSSCLPDPEGLNGVADRSYVFKIPLALWILSYPLTQIVALSSLALSGVSFNLQQ